DRRRCRDELAGRRRTRTDEPLEWRADDCFIQLLLNDRHLCLRLSDLRIGGGDLRDERLEITGCDVAGLDEGGGTVCLRLRICRGGLSLLKRRHSLSEARASVALVEPRDDLTVF